MTILASTQYLSKLVLPGNGSEAVDRINRASRRMRQLLDDLSDYNLATLTKFIPVTFSEVDLAKLCTFEIADLRSAYEGRNVVFRGEGDLNGVWDPVRLQQLLSNLLKNAIDYGAPEKDIEVSASGTGDEVTVSVLNRGKPIPPDIKARIFEPLVRGDSAERPTHGNLGLGLFIAREIAHAHHGALHVRSDSQATVFTIQMPRNSRAALGLSQ
jgi:signal transduction histidine kinase